MARGCCCSRRVSFSCDGLQPRSMRGRPERSSSRSQLSRTLIFNFPFRTTSPCRVASGAVLSNSDTYNHTESHPSSQLAPSPRILAYLIRRGRTSPQSMALVTVDHLPETPMGPEFEPPPATITTPCDPWPRPYYLESGLRRVLPYHFTYNTNCKERWRGRTILDIFSSEFRDRPQEYYVRY
jgi:hypothetical protein